MTQSSRVCSCAACSLARSVCVCVCVCVCLCLCLCPTHVCVICGVALRSISFHRCLGCFAPLTPAIF
jgi:hypothetical protein